MKNEQLIINRPVCAMLRKEQGVQVSDTTKHDSSNAACKKIT